MAFTQIGDLIFFYISSPSKDFMNEVNKRVWLKAQLPLNKSFRFIARQLRCRWADGFMSNRRFDIFIFLLNSHQRIFTSETSKKGLGYSIKTRIESPTALGRTASCQIGDLIFFYISSPSKDFMNEVNKRVWLKAQLPLNKSFRFIARQLRCRWADGFMSNRRFDIFITFQVRHLKNLRFLRYLKSMILV
ncbi:hypothetical protein J2127_001648 [Methanococcus voltae]|nr:hypothetical protein [Methanococcus voltae]